MQCMHGKPRPNTTPTIFSILHCFYEALAEDKTLIEYGQIRSPASVFNPERF